MENQTEDIKKTVDFEYRRMLPEAYAAACDAYLDAFCIMYGIDRDPDPWIGGETCGLAEVADIIVGMADIRLCVDREVPWDSLMEWYLYTLDASDLGLSVPSLKAWLAGCPRSSRETIEHLYALRREMDGIVKQERERK